MSSDDFGEELLRCLVVCVVVTAGSVGGAELTYNVHPIVGILWGGLAVVVLTAMRLEWSEGDPPSGLLGR